MFAEAIEGAIDISKRFNDLREAFIDLMACYQLLPEFEERRAALINQAKAAGVWQDFIDLLGGLKPAQKPNQASQECF